MRAMRVHGPRDARLAELPRLDLGPGEVLAWVKAVGLCGSDPHSYFMDNKKPAAKTLQPGANGYEEESPCPQNWS